MTTHAQLFRESVCHLTPISLEQATRPHKKLEIEASTSFNWIVLIPWLFASGRFSFSVVKITVEKAVFKLVLCDFVKVKSKLI